MRDEEIAASAAMAARGADLIVELCGDRPRLLTHCNTGGLAAVVGGTALGRGRRAAPARRARRGDRQRDPAAAAGRPADRVGAGPAGPAVPGGGRRRRAVPDGPRRGRRGDPRRRPDLRQRRRGQQDRHVRARARRPRGPASRSWWWRRSPRWTWTRRTAPRWRSRTAGRREVVGRTCRRGQPGLRRDAARPGDRDRDRPPGGPPRPRRSPRRSCSRAADFCGRINPPASARSTRGATRRGVPGGRADRGDRAPVVGHRGDPAAGPARAAAARPARAGSSSGVPGPRRPGARARRCPAPATAERGDRVGAVERRAGVVQGVAHRVQRRPDRGGVAAAHRRDQLRPAGGHPGAVAERAGGQGQRRAGRSPRWRRAPRPADAVRG